MIGGDLTGTGETIDAAKELITEYGWTDAGMHHAACSGKTGQPTCHTNASANERRIDFFFLNPILAQALESCEVEAKDITPFPTHTLLIIAL